MSTGGLPISNVIVVLGMLSNWIRVIIGKLGSVEAWRT